MNEGTTALGLLSYVADAVNAKDAFVRLVDKCREIARADGAAALKAHTHRSGYELLITLGYAYKAANGRLFLFLDR